MMCRRHDRHSSRHLWSRLKVAFFGIILILSQPQHSMADVFWSFLSKLPSKITSGNQRYLISDSAERSIRTSDTNQICKSYLVKFLNGTTDAKDECEALLNAYNAGQCGHLVPQEELEDLKPDSEDTADGGYRRLEDSDYGILLADIDEGSETTSANAADDVMIDDIVEDWACCETIRHYYGRSCNRGEVFTDFTLLAAAALLVLCSFVRYIINRFRVRWITDVGGCILVGVIIGTILKAMKTYDIDNLSFDNNLFLYVLLPPIIFNAAISINKRAFQRYLLPIALYALVGTLMSAALTGFSVYGISKMSRQTSIPMLDSLIFGALISSIDPVAVLNILQSKGISTEDMIYVIIFGESLLNDGVAIVLFDTLVNYLDDSLIVDGLAVWKAVLNFLNISCGSIAIGAISGICCTVFYWALRQHLSSVVEVGIFFCWALIPYYVSDLLGWSGIVSIVAAGFIMDLFVIGQPSQQEHVMGNVETNGEMRSDAESSEQPDVFSTKGQLCSDAKYHVCFVTEVISSLMEMAIFAYLGIVFSRSYKSNWVLNITAIFACNASRAVMVIIISALANLLSQYGSRNTSSNGNEIEEYETGTEANARIDRRIQLVLFFSGLRGAVSLALVENIPVYNSVTKQGSAYKSELKAMTVVSVIFTMFVFGGYMHYLIKRLGIVGRGKTNSSNDFEVLNGQRGKETHEFLGLVGQENDDMGQIADKNIC